MKYLSIMTLFTSLVFAGEKSIPVNTKGVYLGEYNGVVCNNCVSNSVTIAINAPNNEYKIIVADSIWKIIYPVVEKRMYDYNNECFYFEHVSQTDTIYIAGEKMVIPVTELTCYPYNSRVYFTRD